MKIRWICLGLSAALLLPACGAPSGGAPAAQTDSGRVTEETATAGMPPDAAESAAVPAENRYAVMSAELLSRMMARYWTGSAQQGHFVPIHGGEISENLSMIWETAMLMLAMEQHYLATGDEETKERIAAEWAYLREQFSEEQMTAGCGAPPNLAADDTAWSAMLYVSVYRTLGDETALEYARRVILSAYDYFQDGSTAEGLWYCDEKQYGGDRWKSVYAAGFLLAALEYCGATRGTDRYSPELYARTMDLYRWIEDNLRRSGPRTYEHGDRNGNTYMVRADDGLYWCDFNWDRSGRDERFGPDGGRRPDQIGYLNSVSFLFGNMAMAAVNARLWRGTGEEESLRRVRQTVESITRVYRTADGVYLNDRDPATDSAALTDYIRFALTLPGLGEDAGRLLADTAEVIYARCVGEGACFAQDWSREPKDFTTNFMRCANTLAMVSGAAYAASLGLIEG